MQEADDAKTRLAPRAIALLRSRKTIWILLALLFLMLPFLLYQPPAAHLQVNDTTYRLSIASSENARERGLSGRKDLAEGRGMIFIFDKPEKACMWMKDMQFSIDMIWLNDSKEVVYMQQNVSPDTYPGSFCSKIPAKYVIELRAGEVAKQHIAVGQTLKL